MELLVQVASTCKECHRVFLAALQKVLVAGSYDVDKNSKNLMSQGMLVQSNSAGTLGSFRLSKDQASTLEGKKKAVAQKPTGVAKSKKAPAKKQVKGSPKKAVKKPKASQAKKVATKSQAKVKAVRHKMPKAKMAKLKRAGPKIK